MKKIMINILIIFMLMYSLTVVAEAKIIKKPYLKFTNKILAVGKTTKIKVKGYNIQSIKYKSLNRKIAIVNKKGKVKAVRKGKVKIHIVVKYKKSRNSKNIKKRILIMTIKVKKLLNHTHNSNSINNSSNFDTMPSINEGTGGKNPIELPDINF